MAATPGTFSFAALHSEIVNNPAALSYAGNDASVAAAMNAIGAGAGFVVWRNDIAKSELCKSAGIVATDFVNLTALQLSKLALVLDSNNIVDATDSNVRTIFTGIFSGMSSTVTALTALAQRQGSRAEVLWGTGFKVTEQMVGISRNGA